MFLLTPPLYLEIKVILNSVSVCNFKLTKTKKRFNALFLVKNEVDIIVKVMITYLFELSSFVRVY